MKKFSWIFALILALSLAFIGCPTGGDDDDSKPAAPPSGGTVRVTGVTLDKSTADVNIDGAVQLTATVLPSNATNKAVEWESSDETKATVSSTGLVTGIAKGSVVISVITKDGNHMAGCTVNVNDPNLKVFKGTIAITPATDVTVGTELTAVYTPVDDDPATVSYQWQDEEGDITTATTNKYTPLAAGEYSVVISAAGYNERGSAPVSVTSGSSGGDDDYNFLPISSDGKVLFALDKTVAKIEKGSIVFADGGYTYTYTEPVAEGTDYEGAIVRFGVDLGAKTLGSYGSITFKWQATGYKDDNDSVAFNKKLFLVASDEEYAVTSPKFNDDSKEFKGDIVSSKFFVTKNEKYWEANDSITVVGNSEKTITLPIFAADFGKGSLKGKLWFAIYVHAVRDKYKISDLTFVEGAYSEGCKVEGTNDTSGMDTRPLPPKAGVIVKPVYFKADLSANKYKTPDDANIPYDMPVITPSTGVDTDGSITVTFNQDRQRLNIKLTDPQVAALLNRNKNAIKVFFDAEVLADNTSVAKQLAKTFKIKDGAIAADGTDTNFIVFSKTGEDASVYVYKGTSDGDYKDKYYDQKLDGANRTIDLESEVTITDEASELDVVNSSTSGDVFRYHLGDASTGSGWNATSAAGINTIANIKNATLNWDGAKTNPFYFILQHGNYSGGLSEGPSSSNEITIKIKSITIGELAADAPITLSNTDVTGIGATISAGDATNGYTVVTTADWGASYATFQVTLPTGTVLSDYTKIGFDLTLINTQYKPVYVAAFKTKPDAANWNSDAEIAKNTGNAAEGQGVTSTQSLDISIWQGDATDTFTPSADGNVVWIAIRSHCPTGDSYKIENVKFFNPPVAP